MSSRALFFWVGVHSSRASIAKLFFDAFFAALLALDIASALAPDRTETQRRLESMHRLEPNEIKY